MRAWMLTALLIASGVAAQDGAGWLYSYQSIEGRRVYAAKPPHPDQVVGEVRMIAYRPAVAPAPTPQPAGPGARYQQAGSSHFRGFACRNDCSGHEAGYQWAMQRGVSSRSSCSGNSQSFIEGCWAWADEVSQR